MKIGVSRGTALPSFAVPLPRTTTKRFIEPFNALTFSFKFR